MSEAKSILTPTGRIVYGDLYKAQEKDADGKPRLIKNGPNAGQPATQYAFGLAIAKNPGVFWWAEPWGAIIYAQAVAAFPQAVANAVAEIQAGRDGGKFFAFKVMDGDSTIPNKKGRKPSEREGYPGHWIISFASLYAPRVFNRDGSQALVEPGHVKCGYYVQVEGTVAGNESSQNPGVFINPRMVAMQGFGTEIVSGPDASTVGFGGGPAPAGMTAAPPGGMPAAPGAPGTPAAPTVAAPVAPVVAAAPTAAPPPPTAVAPNPAILAAPAAPPPPVAAAAPPPPPAAAAGPVLTAKAPAGVTYAQMIANGWNDATLRQHGYLA
jgi:hypothetical protein